MKNALPRFFALILPLFFLLLTACSALPTQERVVTVRETVVVTRIVEQIVERVVTVQVPVNGAGEPVTAMGTPTPASTLPPLPTAVPTPRATGQRGDFTASDLDKLWEIWRLVERDYYGDLPTDTALTDAIIRAVVAELGDDFTNYFPPDVAKRISDGFRGDFEGIGAFVNTNAEGYFFIVRPIPNTPAERAGMRPNDIIIAVNAESIVGWSTDEVVAVVRGPRGEPVTLTVVREGQPAPFDVTIVRDRIQVPVVETQLLADGRIGYVQLLSFNQLATDQLTEAVRGFVDAGMEGMILDLRDNGGGLLTQAVSVGDLFLDQGLFLIVRDSDGSEQRYDTRSGQPGETIPLVVLVNDNSASASEIVAAALRERERATLIGTQTFGKGSVQTPYTLRDGSEFRVTTANFYSPNGTTINKVGVTPHILLDYTPETLGDAGDLTLQRAVEYFLNR
jgi:carboxyl-terminal processing protease